MEEKYIKEKKKEYRSLFQNLIDKLGYKFSPDSELVQSLLEQEAIIEKRDGSPYCPCQGRTYDRQQDVKIICPCIPFHKDHFDFMKRCWCGLFVHKDVVDPDELMQIPYKEFMKQQRAN